MTGQVERVKSFYPFLLVFLGGGIGATCRYAVDLIPFGSSFPYGTLLVNVLGSLCLGLVFSLTKADASNPLPVLFFGVGVFGGFTTFSGYALHSIKLLEQSQHIGLLLNIGASNVLAIAACALGVLIGRSLA